MCTPTYIRTYSVDWDMYWDISNNFTITIFVCICILNGCRVRISTLKKRIWNQIESRRSVSTCTSNHKAFRWQKGIIYEHWSQMKHSCPIFFLSSFGVHGILGICFYGFCSPLSANYPLLYSKPALTNSRPCEQIFYAPSSYYLKFRDNTSNYQYQSASALFKKAHWLRSFCSMGQGVKRY